VLAFWLCYFVGFGLIVWRFVVCLVCELLANSVVLQLLFCIYGDLFLFVWL